MALRPARQIADSGAQVVATACANYHLRLSELSEHYDLGVECVRVTEVLADALEN